MFLPLLKRTVRKVFFGIGFLGVLSHCSSPESPATVVSDASTEVLDERLPANTYCEQTVDAFCPFYVRCGRMAVSSVEECRTTFMDACTAKYEPRYVALEQANGLSLRKQGVEACKKHLEGVSCDKHAFDLDGPCGAMWQGTHTEGQGCGIDVESFVCANGLTCRVGLDFCGKCLKLAAVGESCGETASCGNNECVNGVCVRRATAGEACGPDVRCSVGLSCSNAVCKAPTIVAPGESCDATHRCPYRSTCISGTCKVGVLLGEACSSTKPCASGYCDATTKICSAPKKEGESCSSQSMCISAQCVSGKCLAMPSTCFYSTP